jgi:hypothetical protein
MSMCLVVTGDAIAAGLLAEPSHLDRLAAYVDQHPTHILRVYRNAIGSVTVEVSRQPGFVVIEEDADPREAARRVLARLEEQS